MIAWGVRTPSPEMSKEEMRFSRRAPAEAERKRGGGITAGRDAPHVSDACSRCVVAAASLFRAPRCDSVRQQASRQGTGYSTAGTTRSIPLPRAEDGRAVVLDHEEVRVRRLECAGALA